MNKQDRREFLTVVTNDQISERIIGISFGEKREYWDDWNWMRLSRVKYWGHKPDLIPPFREWLFDRVEQKILAERDASYHESQEPI